MQQRGKRAPKPKPGHPVRLVWTRTERLWLVMELFLVAALFVRTVTLELHFTHEARLGRTLSAWRAEYHLSSEQEWKIRMEEERFHGGGIVLMRPQSDYWHFKVGGGANRVACKHSETTAVGRHRRLQGVFHREVGDGGAVALRSLMVKWIGGCPAPVATHRNRTAPFGRGHIRQAGADGDGPSISIRTV
jgi:hypothetical protein